MSTRRERRAALRKQRNARGRERRSFPWFTVLVVAVAVIGLIVGLRAIGAFERLGPEGPPIDVQAAKTSGPVGERINPLPAEHIPVTQRFTSYNSTPPTSGPHWAQPDGPRPWGVYDKQQPDEAVVHNLEHGGIVIAYNKISQDDVARLRSLRDRYPRGRWPSTKILIHPYDKIAEGTIALTAWGWLDTMPAFDEQRIVRFIAAHLDECCEQVP